MVYLFAALIGYLFGSFPTGYFAGRLWGVDVRKHGSGRTGGSNVLRSAGWGAFAVTGLGDLFKGSLAILLLKFLFPDAVDAHAFAVYFVLLGHVWSVWIALMAKPDPRVAIQPGIAGALQSLAERGRGGAGVAPTVGAILVLFPPLVAIVAIVPFAALIISGYSSVGSLTAAALAPVVMLYFALTGLAPWSYFIVITAACATIIVLHAPNIARLRAGTERKFGQRLGRKTSKSPEKESV
ncbi:MAG: glycerol-3-phosphate acyltransferase [Chloroflexi bacterium]|nr:glycerol-3-phosphate acyltransferase [Chloroflexota bacterium]